MGYRQPADRPGQPGRGSSAGGCSNGSSPRRVAAGRPAEYLTMWLIVAAIGFASIIGLIVYNALVRKAKPAESAAG